MTTMYKMRKLLYERQRKELSEYKAMHVLIQYLPDIWHALIEGTDSTNTLLNRILNLLKEVARKLEKGLKRQVWIYLVPFYKTGKFFSPLVYLVCFFLVFSNL